LVDPLVTAVTPYSSVLTITGGYANGHPLAGAEGAKKGRGKAGKAAGKNRAAKSGQKGGARPAGNGGGKRNRKQGGAAAGGDDWQPRSASAHESRLGFIRDR